MITICMLQIKVNQVTILYMVPPVRGLKMLPKSVYVKYIEKKYVETCMFYDVIERQFFGCLLKISNMILHPVKG